MADTLTARDQTLTPFGLNGDAFALLAQATARGRARLVPFDQLWDGYDPVGELTRVMRTVV
jgi:hypothetical protein